MKSRAVAVMGILAVLGGAAFLWRPAADDRSGGVAVRERYVSAEGKVEVRPGFEVEVGSEIEGKIADFPLKEGDRVIAGEVIARMESRDIQARLKEAEAELAVSRSKLDEVASGARPEEINSAAALLESARADLEFAEASARRYRALFEQRVVSKQLLDDKERHARSARAMVTRAAEEKRLLEKGPKRETIRLQEDLVRRAEASVDYCRKLLEKTVITAPISGKIIRKYLAAGECATKEQPLAAIADISRIWVNAEVDESDIGLIQPGDPVEVRTDAFPDKTYTGEVEEIADYAGSRKVRPNSQAKNLDVKVVQVKVRPLEETPHKPGMTVEVRIKPR